MSNQPFRHPDQDILTEFGHGRLDPSESSWIEQHLSECQDCCDTLMNLKDDTFTGLVRSLTPPADQVTSDGSLPESQDAIEPEDSQPAPLIQAELTDGAVTDDVDSHAMTKLVQSGEPAGISQLPDELREHPRYRIIEQIGQGGMGAVYRAQHRLMNRPVALKLINSQLVRHPQAVERFRREVQTAARLTHPNIVTAFDAEQAGDVHFLVMEFVEGIDLATVVQQRGPLAVEEACDQIRQAAVGLQHAFEKGMVHRDIKPHNLMLSPNGQVRILDFGLAGFATESAILEADSAGGNEGDTTPLHLTTFGSVMGTPDYIAPEQARDAHSADIRADIYSLGCTLCFLLSGKAPFAANSVVDKLKAHVEQDPPALDNLRDDVPSELADIVNRMMAKDPADRFQSPAEVAAALAPFAELDTEPAVAAVETPGNRRTLISVCMAAVITLLAGVIFVVTTQGNFEVRSDIDGVEVTVSKDGKTFRVLDVNSGTSVFWLPSEEFQVKARGDVDVSVSHDNVRVNWMGRQVIRISRASENVLLSDQERLQGTWVAESGQRGGQAIPVEQIPMQRAVFDGDKLTVTMPVDLTDEDGMTQTGVFQLKTKQDPKQISIQPEGRNDEMPGIYQLEGDRLTLCVNQNRQGPIPTRFESPPGTTIDLIVLRRVGIKVSPTQPTEFTLLKTLDGHYRAGSGDPISLSKDGTVLASCGQHDARIWRLPEGKLVTQLSRQKASVANVALSPDGKMAATSELKVKTIFLWELPAGKLVGTLPTDLSSVARLAFSPDGKWLAVSGSGGVDVLDIESNKAVNQYRAEAYFTAFCFTPDGKSLVLGPNRLIWEIASGKTEHVVSTDAGLTAVQVTADGKTLAGANGRSNQILLWDLKTGRQLASLVGHEARVWSLQFLPVGQFLISGSEDGSIRIWNWQTGQEVARRNGLKHLANHVLPSPDGRTAVSFGHWYQGAEPDPDKSDWSVHLWQLPESVWPESSGTAGEIRRFEGHTGPVSCVALSPDGSQALTGSGDLADKSDKTVRLWDVATGRQLQLFAGHTRAIRSVAFTADGRHALSGSWDGTVRLWELESGKELHRFEDPNVLINSISVSPDGKWMVSAGQVFRENGNRGSIRLWDLEQRSPVEGFGRQPFQIFSVAFSPDSSSILTGSHDLKMRLWDVISQKELRPFVGHTHYVGDVRISPNGRQALSAGTDDTVRLWEVASGKELHRFDGHTADVVGLAFLPDGRHALSSGADGTVRLWDLETGKDIHTFTGHTGWVFGVACSSDGRQAISVGADQTVRLWQLPESVWSKHGWLPLFNGRDLTGWKTHSKQPGNWQVEGNAIVGRGPRSSHLYSERDDYENFHLRAEMKLSGGDSGIFFRCGSSPTVTVASDTELQLPAGYEANVCFGPNQLRTGSLWVDPGIGLTGPKSDLIEPDQWFTLEMLADGNHIVVKVNGSTTADFVDTDRRHVRGHLALQVWTRDNPTVVQFRKIEIKELPRDEPTALERLQGKWVPISAAILGKELSTEQLARMSITLTGNHAELTDPDSGQAQTGTFEINPDRTPKHIDFIAPDGKERMPGIFEFDGERFKLAWIDGDYARPTDFNPAETPDHMTAVFKRVPGSVPTTVPHDASEAGPTLMKRLEPTDELVTKEGVTQEDGGWKIESGGPREVILLEVMNPGIRNRYLFAVATLDLKHDELTTETALFVRVIYPSNSSAPAFSRKPLTEESDWKTHTVRATMARNPDFVKIQVGLSFKGKDTVRVRNISLQHEPIKSVQNPPQRRIGILTNSPSVPPGGVPVGKNLIVDPSLEDTAVGERYPSGWGIGNLIPKDAFQHQVVDGGRTGKHGWMIAGDGQFAVIPTNRPTADRAFRYAARAWVKIESGAAQIKLLYFDAAGQYLGENRSVVSYQQDGWHRLTMVDDLAKFPTATKLSLAPTLIGKGKAVFDDFEMLDFDVGKLPKNFEAEYGGVANNTAAMFDRWVGRWDSTTIYKPTAASPNEQTITGRVVVRKILDDRFLLWQWFGEGTGDQYISILGWDEYANGYHIWLFGSGGEAYERIGTWDAASQTLSLALKPPSPNVSGSSTDRFVSNDRIESALQVKANGQVTRDMHATWLRKSSTVSTGIDVSSGPVAGSDELALLSKMAGEWTIKQTMKPSVWFPDGGTESIQERADWAIGGRFLMFRSFKVAGSLREPNPLSEKADYTKMKTLAFMTWDEKEKSYRYWHFASDVAGGQWRITWDASSRGFHWRSIDMPAGWIGTGFNRWIDDDTFDNAALIKDENGRVLFDSQQDKRRKK